MKREKALEIIELIKSLIDDEPKRYPVKSTAHRKALKWLSANSNFLSNIYCWQNEIQELIILIDRNDCHRKETYRSVITDETPNFFRFYVGGKAYAFVDKADGAIHGAANSTTPTRKAFANLFNIEDRRAIIGMRKLNKLKEKR